MMEEAQAISAEFPYTSKFIEVKGAKMHYIDEGEGLPILFLHGIPTSSYLWRNIIPYLSNHARCIAVDLIGMGQSDKPDIDYRIFDHISYIDQFIEQLGLTDLTLVMHEWGSVVGFDYFVRHQENVKALAFFESHIRPTVNWEMISLPVLELVPIFEQDDAGYDVIVNSNYYVNKVLPSGVMRQLSEVEMSAYRAPFATPGSGKPIWQYLKDLPFGDGASDVVDLIARYSKILTQAQVPKLMMYAVPGFITTIDTVRWARDHLPNLKLVDVGDALHYAQETNPAAIGEELARWYQHLLPAKQPQTA